MPIGSLWLPGVVSAVAVFIVSALVHMVLRYHRADYRQLPNEESVAQALRQVAPGFYVFPYCKDGAQMKDPAMVKRFVEGPVGAVVVRPSGAPNLGKYLAQWFLLCLLVSFVTAYVARHTLTYTTPGLQVFQITGAVAFMAYAFGYLQDGIWKGIPWANCLRGILDAVLYALTTGLVFRFLWPAA